METTRKTILKDAFNKLKEFEDVEKIKEGNDELWLLRTPILVDEYQVQYFLLIIYFPKDFPQTIPTIRVSNNNIELPKELKGKPHIFPSGFVCTFDSETVVTDVKYPFEIIYDCIKRAKRIIEDGFRIQNQSDYFEEFLAYWDQKYSKDDEVFQVLTIIDEDKIEIQSLKFSGLDKEFGGIRYILHNEGNESKQFFKNLESFGIAEDHSFKTLYVGEISLGLPPYDFNNRQIIDLIKANCGEKVLEQFRRYVNKEYQKPLIIVFTTSLNNDFIFLGWKLKHPKKHIDGFRKKSNSLSPYKYLSKQGRNERAHFRLSTLPLNSNRIYRRTAGNLEILSRQQKKFIFSIVGTGSIGSNLIFFLKSLGIRELRLIDPDKLDIENIGRHLLGFQYVSKPKVEALRESIIGHSPHLNILTKRNSVFEVFQEDPRFLNESDYIFVAVGKYNVENWLVEQLIHKKLNKPIFILWVEPFLVGGHLIYIPGNCTKNIFEEIHDNFLYKYNVISKKEYNSENEYLTMKEAGCHTSFTPYSSSNVVLFLSSVFPKINEIISSESSKPKAFTWIGPVQILSELKIKRSVFGSRKKQGQLIEHDILNGEEKK